MEPVTERLKRLRESAVPKLSVRKMADALEMAPSTYATYETDKKYKKPILPLDLSTLVYDLIHG